MGMMLFATFQLRSARTVPAALEALTSSSRIEKIMPAATVLLLITGSYMTHDRWTWSTPWIDVSIAGLLLITAFQKASVLDSNLCARLCDPFCVVGSGLNIGLVAGVMLVMVTKPSLWLGIADVIIGGVVVGAAFSMLMQSRQPNASYDAQPVE